MSYDVYYGMSEGGVEMDERMGHPLLLNSLNRFF